MRPQLISTVQGSAVLLTPEIVEKLHIEEEVDVELTDSSLVIRRALSLEDGAKHSDAKLPRPTASWLSEATPT